ncbi:hypothetical protein AKO1_014182 [Acrasis kona]|uniref:F-box/LRR-repeat protein 14 n=1 Tax=Acrasis kona TaxID=1008807 RepID=A0AAW2Z0H9_9EUKA
MTCFESESRRPQEVDDRDLKRKRTCKENIVVKCLLDVGEDALILISLFLKTNAWLNFSTTCKAVESYRSNTIINSNKNYTVSPETTDDDLGRIFPTREGDVNGSQLRGICNLNMFDCNNITNKGLFHLRGLKHLQLLNCTNISAEGFKHLKGIQKLTMIGSRMNDHGLSYLNGIRVLTVDFSSAEVITDAGISNLSGIWKLDISNCIQLTDVGLSYLTGIHTLDITFNVLVTDKGFSYLKGISVLFAHWSNITDVGLSYLEGIDTLGINQCKNITDVGYSYLKGIRSLEAHGKNITDEGLSYLRGIEILDLEESHKITDVGLSYLAGILNLRMDGRLITNVGLHYLRGIKSLYLLHANGVTDDSFKHLGRVMLVGLEYCNNVSLTGLANIDNCFILKVFCCANIPNIDYVIVSRDDLLATQDNLVGTSLPESTPAIK